MKAVSWQILLNLLKRKGIQFSLLLVVIAIGLFSALSYQNFLFLQAQNISQLSVFNEIIKPLSGLVLLTQLFIVSLSASQIIPYYSERGQSGLLLHSCISNSRLVLSALRVIFSVSLLPFCYFLLVMFGLALTSDIDIGLIASTSFALLLGNFLFSLIVLTVTLSLKKSLMALIAAISAILIIFGIDEFLRSQLFGQPFSIFLNSFIHLRDGLIIPSEVIGSLCWALFFFSISILLMQRLRLSGKKTGMLFILAAIFLLSVNSLFSLTNNNFQWDISRTSLNSLGTELAEKIVKIKAPIVVTAVIDDEKNHDEIRKAFDIIKRYHNNLELVFSSRQALASQSQFVDQFVMVEIDGQQQSIRYPFDRNAKDSLLHMMIQLTTRTNQWITFIEGHSEASPFGKESRDLGSFYQSLRKLGWPVAMQNLSKQPIISTNTQVLVIADSQKHWLPSEIDSLMKYLNRGGNLLVLREAGDYIPDELQALLAIETISGNLIDWQGYQSGTPHPAILMVNQFGSHVVNTNIDSLLAFPWSLGLSVNKENMKSSNEYQIITKTHVGVWNEFNSEEVELTFNPEIGELRQAFNLAIGIKNKKSNQRIIVVGDSSFLSDSAINNYANRQFSLNLISWLSSQNVEQVDVGYKDNFIRVSYIGNFLLNWLFSLILPIVILFFLIWIRFKKASNVNVINKTVIENTPRNERKANE